jgi:F-type H+-transporting ATPase subunit b
MKPTWKLALIAASLLVATPALAAGGGGETWLGLPRWIFLTINLTIFLGAIIKFGIPRITAFLDARSTAIRESLALAKRQEADVAALSQRLEEGLAKIEREIVELEAKTERDAAREQADILTAAEAEKVRIAAQALAEREHRIDQARAELTRHAATLAAQLAAHKLDAGLDDSTRARFFADGVASLERSSP